MQGLTSSRSIGQVTLWGHHSLTPHPDVPSSGPSWNQQESCNLLPCCWRMAWDHWTTSVVDWIAWGFLRVDRFWCFLRVQVYIWFCQNAQFQINAPHGSPCMKWIMILYEFKWGTFPTDQSSLFQVQQSSSGYPAASYPACSCKHRDPPQAGQQHPSNKVFWLVEDKGKCWYRYMRWTTYILYSLIWYQTNKWCLMEALPKPRSLSPTTSGFGIASGMLTPKPESSPCGASFDVLSL